MTEGLPTIKEEGNWGSKASRDYYKRATQI